MELILIILTIFLAAAGYGIWNLLKKLERLEDMLNENLNTYSAIIRVMREIDSTGAFESDDEVGSIFKDLKNLIEKNEKILRGE